MERRNPSLEIDLTGAEFLRTYDPTISYWTLTPTGTARVESGAFPHGIGIKGPGVLRILNRLGAVEEDEMAGFIGLTPGGVRRILKRLAGFGLVAQAK